MQNTDASKLEKADILELTVQHLRSLRRQSRNWPSATPTVKTVEGVNGDKFRAGFAECAHEVSAYISTLDCVDNDVRSRLLTHLGNCINRMPCLMPPTVPPTHTPYGPTSSPFNAGALTTTATPPRLDATASHLCHNMPPLSTPTPPQSPVSPAQMCGTPTCTVTPTVKTDYVVPVSPVSPPPPLDITPYGGCGRYGGSPGYVTVRSDVYVWPEMPTSKSSINNNRSSPLDTRTYTGDDYYCYDRMVMPESPQSVIASSKEVTVDSDTHHSNKPWRPW